MCTTALAINDAYIAAGTPSTNMEVAAQIAARAERVPSPYFDQEIHDYLLSKGAEFVYRSTGRYMYVIEVNGERMRLYFRGDAEGEMILIQFLWEEAGMEEGVIERSFLSEDGKRRIYIIKDGVSSMWLTDHRFSHPGSLDNFRIILNAYLNEYAID